MHPLLRCDWRCRRHGAHRERRHARNLNASLGEVGTQDVNGIPHVAERFYKVRQFVSGKVEEAGRGAVCCPVPSSCSGRRQRFKRTVPASAA